jgi:1-acylglycerone phosphate reductase
MDHIPNWEHLSSPTPWNAAYSSSKAALHNLTGVIYQECKPFNIKVTTVVPGAIKSNIANNQFKAGVVLPENSLYKSFTDAIIRRVSTSQGSNALPAEEFARTVVRQTLLVAPPYYMTLGGNSFVFALLAWLPRSFALNIFWKRFK